MKTPLRRPNPITGNRAGRVAHMAIGIIAGGVVILASCSYYMERLPDSSSGFSMHRLSNPTRTIRAQLMAAGLSPDVLCAAGLTAQQAEDVAEHGLAHLDENLEDLTTADAALAAASADVTRLERLAMQGRATEPQMTELATARASLASALSARATAQTALFNAATDGLSGGTKTLIQRFHAHRTMEVPLKYRGTERTEAQWIALRDALSNQAIATRLNEELESASATLLAAEGATEETIRATAALANLADVRTAWYAASAVVE